MWHLTSNVGDMLVTPSFLFKLHALMEFKYASLNMLYLTGEGANASYVRCFTIFLTLRIGSISFQD